MANRLATVLKNEALDHLKNDPELLKEVCDYAGINPLYAIGAINSGSRSFTTYKAVMAIAKSMNKNPLEIIEEIVK